MMKRSLVHLIGAGILFVALIAAYGAWFVMVDRQVDQTRALRSEIATKSQATARIAAAKAALTALESDEAAIEEHFVVATDVVPFLERFQTTGAALGTKVQIISVSAENGKTRNRLNLAVQISGSFDAVMRTLGSFEYAPYDITVTNLTVTTQGGEGKAARTWEAAANFSIGTATGTPRTLRPAALPPVPLGTTSPAL